MEQRHALQGIALLIVLLLVFPAVATGQVNFSSGGLQGENLLNPTSLQFGPDERLYVSQQNGTIYAYTVQRNGPSDYQVTDTETINLVKGIPNYNDDGTLATGVNERQVTGIYVTGTGTSPVLYVSSSDPRIGAGGGGEDLGLDTNSGIISKLTCTGGVSGNQCQGWDIVHLVRGLPRSEENHATNGLQLDEVNNILFVAQGGHANAGGISNNFAFANEYALSAAILSVDLDVIEAMPTKTDAQGQPYKYDLPTLDDPDRVNKADGSDPGDPFGGNNGLNMAKLVEGGPVQIYSPGWRNAYDLVITEDGKMYAVDNGANGGWGGYPEYEESFDCTNNYLSDEPGSTGPGPDPATYPDDITLLPGSDGQPDAKVNNKDNLHYVPGPGYYAGHPTPIRANPAGAGLYTNGVFRDGTDPNNPLPADWPAVPENLANPVECDYHQPGVDDGALYTWTHSTNGLAEYTASNFSGALMGNLLAAGFNGTLYRIELNAAGDAVTNVSSFASSFGSNPLDVTVQGDNDIFGGTVWAVTYGANNITIFEPEDYGGEDLVLCSGDYDLALDEDGDGYSNADEIDNDTDPCSSSSQPADFDGDFISDLNDTDDDTDGLLDTEDPFAIDADNGTTTELPVNHDLFNATGYGFGGIGFTGLMLNGSDYLELLDPDDDLILGGTSGLFTDPSVGDGDAFQGDNSQVNAFQFGVDVDASTSPFTIEVKINGPFGISGDYASQGFYIGTGDQDNYLKVVVNDGNGSGGIEVLKEVGGTKAGDSPGTTNIDNLLNASTIKLYLSINPAAGTAQPKYATGSGSVTLLGSSVSIPTSWLDANDDRGLAVGFITTSTGPAPEFAATWDYVYVTLDPVSDDQPPEVEAIADQSVEEGQTLEVSVSASDPDGDAITLSAQSADGSALPSFASFTDDGDGTGAMALSPSAGDAGTYALEVTATAGDAEDSEGFTVTVTTAAEEPAFAERVNAGGEAYTDGQGNAWKADTYSSGGNPFGKRGQAIAGTEDDVLYERERHGKKGTTFSYHVPLSGSGPYTARLHFAEIYHGVVNQASCTKDPGVSCVGQRVFDVAIEGTTVLEDYDIYAEVGAATAVVKTFSDLSDANGNGTLDISFSASVGDAKVSALEVLGEGSNQALQIASMESSLLEGPALRLSVEAREANTEDEVFVPVMVEDFTDIASVQFTLEWDAKALEFIGLDGFGLEGLNQQHFSIQHADEGFLAVTWNHPQAEGQTLEDTSNSGAQLFGIRFRVHGQGGRQTHLRFTSGMTALKAHRGQALRPVQLATTDGTLILIKVPERFVVKGNYPNPFGQRTNLTFDLPEKAEVEVAVYDALGRLVLRLPAQEMAAGTDRTLQLDAQQLSPGMYFYRLTAKMASQQAKVANGRFTVVR